jgi:PAS domain S-box-containing protein
MTGAEEKTSMARGDGARPLDTTELKNREPERVTEEDLLRALLSSSPDAIYFKDLESRFLRASAAMAILFNCHSVEELIGRRDHDFFAGEHAQQALADEQEIIRTGKAIIGRVEKEAHPDGRVTWALSSKMPLRNSRGEIIGTFGISKNITALKEAEEQLEKVHRQLVTVSREAGMAEIATNVLHNVGNVLNSVVVSTGLIGARLRDSKTKGFVEAMRLMDDHRADLGDFLSKDERGKLLPNYLQKLVATLSAERTYLLEELASLNKGLDHIRDIVTTQQSYARAPASVLEPLLMRDLLEDSLRMNVGSIARREVSVVKHWPNVPESLLDKHLVLQIIVNLLGNAIQAMEGVTDRPRRLTVRAEKITAPRTQAATDTNATGPSDALIRVEVEDNGEGITPENLARLFTHGFTTRKSGHGFGLHSCALAAKAMGGTIRAHSEGLDKGARFTLDLPFKAP